MIELIELVELVQAELEVDARTNAMQIERTLCNACPRGPRLLGSTKQLTFLHSFLHWLLYRKKCLPKKEKKS